MRSLITAVLALLVQCSCAGQQEDPLAGRIFFGFGAGLDHGGFGVRADIQATHHFGFFGGARYAIAGIGWNAGLVARLLPDKRVVPYVIGMYGYNAFYVATDRTTRTQYYRDLYYGPSFGAGAEIMNRGRTACWRFGLLVPIRSDQIEIDHPGVSEDLWPVLLSIGYHFRV